METLVLTIHILIALALIGSVLLQRSEGGGLGIGGGGAGGGFMTCLLYTSPSPRDATLSRMPSSA